MNEVYTVDYILENEIDKKAYGFIYITTNLVNGKKYIGQRKFNNGWEYYLGSGVVIKDAIKKYKKENFKRDIVKIANSKEDVNTLEIRLINEYNAVESNEYYNIAKGGEGGAGKRSSETKKKISNSHKGIKPSEEAIKKRLNTINEKYGKLIPWNKGLKIPSGIPRKDETKIKISNARKGIVFSEETKQKMSKTRKGKYLLGNNPNAREVYCINDNLRFDTVKSAMDYYKCSDHISECCKDKRKSCGKHPETGESLKWMYYEDYIKEYGEII